ncbi:MAG: IRE (iron responsive element) [Planctomycetota bacterium]
MNRSTFGRKVIYLAIMVAMMIPLYWLGQPASGEGDRSKSGELAAMRSKYNIAAANLGEIDPSSETMKLTSLGMRGVAATILKNKAERFQTLHEWDRHRATVNNLVRLQPHFERVWEYEAHNLTYNVSKEFDDYRQRYEMVRQGSEFLIEGVRKNRKAPRLIWYTGWFYGAKIGMADEKRQFRRLFGEDTVGHQNLDAEGIAIESPEALGPNGKPDNWLVGRLWLEYGYDLVDNAGVEINRQTPLNFYETGPKWRLKHAEAIESEGILDDRARNAWQLGAESWSDFGNRSIETTSPFTIKLDSLDEMIAEREEKRQAFRALIPEIFDAERQRKYDALRDRFKDLLGQPDDELIAAQLEMKQNLLEDIQPDLDDLMNKVPSSKRLTAIGLIGEIDDLAKRIRKTRGSRDTINYPYWKTLAQAEQQDRMVKARRLVYEAEKFNAEARLDEAIESYEEAFEIWAGIFRDYPVLTIDDAAMDLFKSIRRYMVAIDSDELDEDFPLHDFTKLMIEGDGQIPAGLYAEVIAGRVDMDDVTGPAGNRDGSASEPSGAPEKEEPAAGQETPAPPTEAATGGETSEMKSEDPSPATGEVEKEASDPADEASKTAMEKSESGTEKSESGTEKPESGTEKPESGTEKSESGTEKPESGTDKPESGTEKSESGTEKSESGTEKSESGTEKSESGTEKPESGTEKPESGTEKPESGTEKPESGTEKPESGTEKSEGSAGSGNVDTDDDPS